MNAFGISFIGGLATGRLCGYAVQPSDIHVLVIGLIVGARVVLVGCLIVEPLTHKFTNLIFGSH